MRCSNAHSHEALRLLVRRLKISQSCGISLFIFHLYNVSAHTTKSIDRSISAPAGRDVLLAGKHLVAEVLVSVKHILHTSMGNILQTRSIAHDLTVDLELPDNSCPGFVLLKDESLPPHCLCYVSCLALHPYNKNMLGR